MKRAVVLVTVLVVASVSVVLSVVAATDENDVGWPTSCEEAPIVTGGTYSGQFHAEGEQEALLFRIEKGDYIGFTVSPVNKVDELGIAVADKDHKFPRAITDHRSRRHERQPGAVEAESKRFCMDWG